MPWLVEPDGAALSALLRHVIANSEEARAKGRAGREYAEVNLTWGRAAAAVEARVGGPAACPDPASLHSSTVVVSRHSRPRLAEKPYRARVSLCLIVKNEEANLADCLASAAGLCTDIVVLDTGSTDRTKEIALAHSPRV